MDAKTYPRITRLAKEQFRHGVSSTLESWRSQVRTRLQALTSAADATPELQRKSKQVLRGYDRVGELLRQLVQASTEKPRRM